MLWYRFPVVGELRVVEHERVPPLLPRLARAAALHHRLDARAALTLLFTLLNYFKSLVVLVATFNNNGLFVTFNHRKQCEFSMDLDTNINWYSNMLRSTGDRLE